MTNQEIFNASSQLYQDVLDNKITTKDSKIKLKDLNAQSKRISNRLKSLAMWMKVAKSRNELIEVNQDSNKSFFVPASSVSFYPGLENYKEFNGFLNETEYCCLFGND